MRDGFVPNDLALDGDEVRFLILTGPNMAGKSTLLRQVALIALLAQAGSFVPAKRARIGVADRIFTRVGRLRLPHHRPVHIHGRDERNRRDPRARAASGAWCCLDEIGRGTSTFDGLSIAWAVAEYLHDTAGLRARVLFATHYHELADLARTKSAVPELPLQLRRAGWRDPVPSAHGARGRQSQLRNRGGSCGRTLPKVIRRAR